MRAPHMWNLPFLSSRTNQPREPRPEPAVVRCGRKSTSRPQSGGKWLEHYQKKSTPKVRQSPEGKVYRGTAWQSTTLVVGHTAARARARRHSVSGKGLGVGAAHRCPPWHPPPGRGHGRFEADALREPNHVCVRLSFGLPVTARLTQVQTAKRHGPAPKEDQTQTFRQSFSPTHGGDHGPPRNTDPESTSRPSRQLCHTKLTKGPGGHQPQALSQRSGADRGHGLRGTSHRKGTGNLDLEKKTAFVHISGLDQPL